ncbi:hypothetical protein VQ643_15895 [Pseudomonas sp. F1_0610]|uniref:hypothetical protein n=1 Tax=Pseudomonas sp. F1_0610 TaxID=3114284 RepID=UPI0039C248F2
MHISNTFFKKSLKLISFFIGLFSLVFSSLLYVGVFFINNEYFLNGVSLLYFLVAFLLFFISAFLCLWGASKQSFINYFRLFGLPVALTIAMRFSYGGPSDIFIIGIIFITLVVLWNFILTVLRWLLVKFKAGF